MEAEIFFMTIQNGLGKGQFFFKIKNVSISWDALLHFLNTKMYFLMLLDNVCTIQALFVTKPMQ